jgi:glycosyltransferase involved in cell wall biosynthesis
MVHPIRFCMITTFYPPYNFGGDGVFVQRLSNELARRGHHVEVIHCVDSYRLRTRREPLAVDEDHPSIVVHRLKSPLGLLSPLATQQTGHPLFKAARIRKILDCGFDVIHYHNISLVGGPKILEYGQGIKLYTMHEYWLLCPTHMLFRFDRRVCTRPNCFLCGLMYKRPPQWWRYTGLLKAASKHVDAFIAPSEFSRDKHLEMGLDIPIAHLPHFAPNVAAQGTTAVPPIDKPSREPYFLFVGRLEKLKGLQTLIPLFRGYHRARLLVAGRGSYESALRRMAKDCDNVQFLGHQSSQQLQALYRNAVALIVPSIGHEVFGQVIIEAFGQRTPVIVNNTGGMPEIVRQSGGGFVYSSEKELLTAMDRMLASPARRRELALNGYRALERYWTLEDHLESYLKLIRNVSLSSTDGP